MSSPPRTKKQGNERLLLIGRLPSIITLVSCFGVQHLFFVVVPAFCQVILRGRHMLLLAILIKKLDVGATKFGHF